jgi:hypothetical protein
VESSGALIKIVLASIVNIITPLVDYTFTCGGCITPPARRYDVPGNASVSTAMSMMAQGSSISPAERQSRLLRL